MLMILLWKHMNDFMTPVVTAEWGMLTSEITISMFVNIDGNNCFCSYIYIYM